jgi:hypothetical protein
MLMKGGLKSNNVCCNNLVVGASAAGWQGVATGDCPLSLTVNIMGGREERTNEEKRELSSAPRDGKK